MSHKNEFISIQGSGACYRIFLGLQVDGPISCVRVCVWRGYKLRGGGGGGGRALKRQFAIQTITIKVDSAKRVTLLLETGFL